MSGTMRRALVALLLAMLTAAAVACSEEADKGVLSSGDRESDDGDSGSDGSGEGGSGQRQAYIDAIATASQNVDADDPDDTMKMSDASAQCFGAAFVDVLGVDELESKVSPEEIAANPNDDPSEWGLEVSQDQGVEIFRSLVECQPTVLEEFGRTMSESMNQGSDTPIDVDVDCLAEVDVADIEDFMGAAIAADSDDIDPTADQAAAIIDWLLPCADLRGAIIAGIAADPSFPEGAAECIDEGVTDDMLRELLIIGFTSQGGDSDQAFEESEVGQAFTEVITDCALAAG